MLSLFPGLLDYSFFAVTLIRIAAGFAFLWIAYFLATRRGEMARTNFPFIRRFPEWLALVYSFVALCTSILLLVGLYTQAAAIAGMIISIDHAIFARKFSHVVAISSAAAFLLFVICLSLLFSGAGALAFDLPL